jgi:hypothetical protein
MPVSFEKNPVYDPALVERAYAAVVEANGGPVAQSKANQLLFPCEYHCLAGHGHRAIKPYGGQPGFKDNCVSCDEPMLRARVDFFLANPDAKPPLEDICKPGMKYGVAVLLYSKLYGESFGGIPPSVADFERCFGIVRTAAPAQPECPGDADEDALEYVGPPASQGSQGFDDAAGVGDDWCYEVLQVYSDATLAEIDKAYKDGAMRFHPDKNPDDLEWAAAKFTELKAAHAQARTRLSGEFRSETVHAEELAEKFTYWREEGEVDLFTAVYRLDALGSKPFAAATAAAVSSLVAVEGDPAKLGRSAWWDGKKGPYTLEWNAESFSNHAELTDGLDWLMHVCLKWTDARTLPRRRAANGNFPPLSRQEINMLIQPYGFAPGGPVSIWKQFFGPGMQIRVLEGDALKHTWQACPAYHALCVLAGYDFGDETAYDTFRPYLEGYRHAAVWTWDDMGPEWIKTELTVDPALKGKRKRKALEKQFGDEMRSLAAENGELFHEHAKMYKSLKMSQLAAEEGEAAMFDAVLAARSGGGALATERARALEGAHEALAQEGEAGPP